MSEWNDWGRVETSMGSGPHVLASGGNGFSGPGSPEARANEIAALRAQVSELRGILKKSLPHIRYVDYYLGADSLLAEAKAALEKSGGVK